MRAPLARQWGKPGARMCVHHLPRATRPLPHPRPPRLEWLAHTLGHEMVHAIMEGACPEDQRAGSAVMNATGGHSLVFRRLNRHLLGHAGASHEWAAGWSKDGRRYVMQAGGGGGGRIPDGDQGGSSSFSGGGASGGGGGASACLGRSSSGGLRSSAGLRGSSRGVTGGT
jgi:uncharacterized membrane protein YgcG